MLIQRTDSIPELGGQRPPLHLLKPDCQNAIIQATSDELIPQHQGRRSRRAVIIDIVDGYPGHANLIQGPLATSGVPVDVPHTGLLDFLVWDSAVTEGRENGFFYHLGVVHFVGSGPKELGHAHSYHVDGLEGAGLRHL